MSKEYIDCGHKELEEGEFIYELYSKNEKKKYLSLCDGCNYKLSKEILNQLITHVYIGQDSLNDFIEKEMNNIKKRLSELENEKS